MLSTSDNKTQIAFIALFATKFVKKHRIVIFVDIFLSALSVWMLSFLL